MTAGLLEMEGLTKRFGEVVALDEVDLKVPAGMITALVGPSGAGKTTLLKIADLLMEPDSGALRIFGRTVRADTNDSLNTRRQMGMVRQQPVVFSSSVIGNVAMGLRFRGVAEAEIEQRVEQALKIVELGQHRHRFAPRLSGGQAQRVAFARAVVVEPRVLLLDEFTANLDPRNVAILERAVTAYIAKRPTERGALVVTHNLFQAQRLSHKVAVMVEGRIVEAGPCRKLFEQAQTQEARGFLEGKMVW